MIVPIEPQSLHIGHFADLPISLGMPPYQRANTVRVRLARPELNVLAGDYLLLDVDGFVTCVFRPVPSANTIGSG